MVELIDIKNKNKLIIANTHLHYFRKLEEIQFRQAEMLINCIDKFNTSNNPVIICGDFNTNTDTSVYNEFANKYSDYYDITNSKPIVTAYYPNEILGMSDYIFLSKNRFTPLTYLKTPSIEEIPRILPVPSEYFPSDHFPIGGSLYINSN